MIYMPKTPAIILALNLKNQEIEIEALLDAGLVFKALTGSYKGVQERSYLVLTHTDEAYRAALNLAKECNQESVLLLDEDRNAKLMYLDDMHQIEIGVLTPVSKDEALKQDAWTYAHDLNQFYICK